MPRIIKDIQECIILNQSMVIPRNISSSKHEVFEKIAKYLKGHNKIQKNLK